MELRWRQAIERSCRAVVTVVWYEFTLTEEPPPVIIPTCSGEAQAVWELENLYHEIETNREHADRWCFVDEHGEGTIPEELNLTAMQRYCVPRCL